MNEILKKLFESEVLTEETKKELTESIQSTINEAVENAKKEAEDKVRGELTTQYLADFEKLVEAVDVKTEEHLKAELAELKEDIQNFRDLETEHAERLVEARQDSMSSDLYKIANIFNVPISCTITILTIFDLLF